MEQGKIMEAEAPTVQGGRHPNRTNGVPIPTTPQGFYRPDAVPAAQPIASKHNN